MQINKKKYENIKMLQMVMGTVARWITVDASPAPMMIFTVLTVGT